MGVLLGRMGVELGSSWASWGRLGGHLEASWPIMGASWLSLAILEVSWARYLVDLGVSSRRNGHF